jgi:2-oxo-4-hydroxy-4-carboxy-5-ureidoimidazoline decarboxylase
MPTLSEINSMSEASFVGTFGSVFEHSPWIARRTWPSMPFGDLHDLHEKMCAVLRSATTQEQLGLIRAHPDLGERLAALTPESVGEQTSAGLDRLTEDELSRFTENNIAYKAKFGFPFIICARLNDSAKMLAAFARRLENNRDEEFLAAIEQIELIAKLRLQSLIP